MKHVMHQIVIALLSAFSHLSATLGDLIYHFPLSILKASHVIHAQYMFAGIECPSGQWLEDEQPWWSGHKGSLVKVMKEPEESRAVARCAGWTGHMRARSCTPCVQILQLCIRCTRAKLQEAWAPHCSFPVALTPRPWPLGTSTHSPTSLHLCDGLWLAHLDTD